MNITVVGTGYVGLVTAACLADLGNKVIGIDIDSKKIENLKKGIIPIYEPGLTEIVKRNIENKNISFSTKLAPAVESTDIIFIAVGTPPKDDGSADLRYVKAVAEEIAKSMNSYKVVVNKSTVPIGTGDMVSGIIKKYYQGEFDVVSNPEFLKEGTAIDDFTKPDRVVIGNASKKAKDMMGKLYEPLNCPILYTDVKTAEMIKYASNSILATEISFINSIANICERVGANVELVAEGMKLDSRIGKHAFLSAGAGYGGSCFPKDVKALINIARRHDYHFSILEKVEEVNKDQRQTLTNKIIELLGNPKGKKVAIWGLAFKPNTDDMREAPAIDIINNLQKLGASVNAYDPVAQEQAKQMLKDIKYFSDPIEATKNADILVILTEWNEFKQLDLNTVKKQLKDSKIVDGRNIYDPAEMKRLGFKYVSIGR